LTPLLPHSVSHAEGDRQESASPVCCLVLAGESSGSKLDMAKELGVEVITEAQFINRFDIKS